MVDTQCSERCGATRGGSIPLLPTKIIDLTTTPLKVSTYDKFTVNTSNVNPTTAWIAIKGYKFIFRDTPKSNKRSKTKKYLFDTMFEIGLIIMQTILICYLPTNIV